MAVVSMRDAQLYITVVDYTVAARALQVAAAALAAVSEDDARTGPLRDAVALARNRLSNAWSPGYEA